MCNKSHLVKKIKQAHSGAQKLLLGSFDNMNFSIFSFAYRHYNNKQVSQIYLFVDIHCEA